MNSKIIAFAIDAHNKVNHHYDNYPYSVHLSMVAMYAVKYIDCIPTQVQDTVINACWLHDTIEDCRLTFNDIKKIAGEEVANIVYAITNEKGKTRKERANENYYKGICQTAWAKYVKLCDRLANVKYSYESKSNMYHCYQDENENFLKALFPNTSEMFHYREMVKELNYMLGVVVA
jgi:(p)ppGpp synthase/HD superfamily hydrolase